jgi:hypothetical protein
MHKREEIFHSINDARGRGVQWAEIAKNVKRNPQSFMREARKTWIGATSTVAIGHAEPSATS